MRKSKFITLVLTVLLTLLPVVSVTMMYHITQCKAIEGMANGYFGDSYTLCSVDDGVKNRNAVMQAVDDIKARVAIYMTKQYGKNKVNAIYYNERFVNFPMRYGHFFTKAELKSGKNMAVIGKNIESSIKEQNGNKYIKLNGKYFRVIGIIGYDRDTIIDDYIYISVGQADGITDGNLCTLDIWGKDTGADEQFAENLSENGVLAEQRAGTAAYSESVFVDILYGRWFIAIFVCDLLCIAVISVQWIKRQQREICIRRLVGAKNLQVLGHILAKYILYTVVSMVLSTLICMLAFSEYMYAIFIGYMTIIPVMLVVIIINVFSAMRVPIAEAVRK